MSGGRVVGLLTLENLGEFLRIQAAMAAGRRPRALRPAADPERGRAG